MKPPNSRWANVVIRASAGTGKTYQLSNRYLQLTADGQPPEQILASTFARKAAGEILERVLVRLADAALEPAARAELASSLERELTAADSRRLLRRLLSDLHRLRIGTLDSFFVQLAGNFTLELGLPAGWKIVDEIDDKPLRLEAIRRVLAEGSSGDLAALVHLVFKGEATRSITEQIAAIVEELYGVFCDSEHAAWHGLPRPPLLTDAELERALSALAGAGTPANGQFAKAWRDDLARAQSQDWDAFIAKGLAKALLCGDGQYYRKPIEPELAELYAPLLRHARGAVIGKLINQTEATHKLLAAYGQRYQELKIARRGLRFDDVPRLLAAGLASGLMEQTPWRLDTPIGHLLLDEFQDTSLSQWNVLRPFAAACCDPAAGSRSLFCVGDVKQAIYRWRGGVAQLFDAACDQLPGLAENSLATSYRSCQVVIDTVNQVFGNLHANLALSDHAEVSRQWSESFELHSTARRQLAGYSTLRVSPRAEEGQDQQALTLEFAAARVAELAAECPRLSIGVLVRRNAAVARLIHLLRSVHKLPASGEGGNPLTDSAAVELVLSLLQLADHPGDRAARFHLAGSPLGKVVDFERYDDDRRAEALARQLRRTLLDEGYGRIIGAWVRALAPSCGPRDLDRLMQLVELGYGFERRAGIRPGEFAAFVREKKVEDPAAAMIRVMTIHQAKGLQFDLVVLPELDTMLKGPPPKIAIGRRRPVDPIERICRHARQDLRALLPAEYQQLFEVWPREAVNESLCMLYVGLTRAVHALHMLIAPAKTNEGKLPQTFAGVLRAALGAGRAAEPEAVLYEHGRRDWFGAAASAEPARQPAVDPRPIELQLRRAAAGARQWERHSPSSLEGGSKIRLADRLRAGGGATRERGTLWHAWFEQVAWLDDELPDVERLRSLARAEVSGLDLDEQLAHFQRVLAQAELARVLGRAQYADPRLLGWAPATAAELARGPCEPRLFRERRFAVREAEGLLSGTIDRLVLLVRGDKVLAADLIDFKTDRLRGATQISDRVEFYRPQMAAYRRAVARLYQLEPGQIISRLVFVENGAVHAVEGPGKPPT